MATNSPQEPTRSIQAGLEATRISYYDIMVIGNAGQGKSTTSDKIIIANPDGVDYALNQPGNQPQGMAVDEQNQQVKYTDISMWLAHGSEKTEFETHLKFLHYCRTKDKPHEEINKIRSALREGANQAFEPTKDCEVLSNDTSRVRLMDVPGFFDGAKVSVHTRQQDNPARAGASDAPSPDRMAGEMSALDQSNLDIMRRIIRIQTALSMKFNRILYFLPTRGPLERANAHLKLELKWMAHYFDRAIFKSMVLVATVSARFSKMNIPDEDKFPQEDIDMTKRLFREALVDVFNNSPPDDPLPDPPLIFVSLTDTCEQILEKIKGTAVQEEGLHLQIDPSACSECGVKIGVVKGRRVTCYFGEDIADAIPYEESTCHPYFVPKYTRLDKIWGGFKHIVSFSFVRNPWPIFEGEKCAACVNIPNTRGCMKVRSQYGKGRQKISVDHTNEVVNAPTEDIATPANVTPEADNAPATTGNGVHPGQTQSNGQNGASHGSLQDTETSMTMVQGGVAHIRINAEHNPNQSYVVEQAADNPAWAERKGT